MASGNLRYDRSVLIINPNTTIAMTDALKPLVDALDYDTTCYEYFTAPSGVPSINDETGAQLSAEHCLPVLREKLVQYDAFLVCCYSPHPLVPQLRAELAKMDHSQKLVAGIFESSVATCLQSINGYDSFGIVTTSQGWEETLGDAVADILGTDSSSRYAGTSSTGLNADELHAAPKEDVDSRMRAATKKLLDNGAKAICLGCAGMAGMGRTVREACVETLGEEMGKRIKIVDGVLSGIGFLEGALRAGL